MSRPTVVALFMPRHGDVKFEATEAYRKATGIHTTAAVVRGGTCDSVLPAGFNSAWCVALNYRARMGLTHFAMLHADVAPEAGWLDTLLGEMGAAGADVVSAVVPIKNDRGLTSTAVGLPGVYAGRRLTMAEVFKLPPTFDAADVERLTGLRGPLLVNTGCFLADLSKGWCDECDAEGRLKWAFGFRTEIRRDPVSGEFVSFKASEDWLFSRHLASVGAKVVATRKVRLAHVGDWQYASDSVWGQWETDRAFLG